MDHATQPGDNERVGKPFPDRLAALLAECARRWRIEIGPPYALELADRFIAPVRCADGSPAVIKIGDPRGEFAHQVAALRHFDGRGTVRLLNSAADIGAMLLERAEPGAGLSLLTESGDDDRAVRIASGVMRLLQTRAPASCGLPTVREWARRLDAVPAGGVSADLLDSARARLTELHADSLEHFVLHGDLHHGNVLSAERSAWLAIDPKGVVGDRGFEIGPFLRNPSLQSVATLARRIAIFAEELGMDRDRLLAWALVDGALSASWYLEDLGFCPAAAIEHCRRLATIVA